ncbi:D-alanine-D-alanine ligase [Scopulibacillus daqui]|uniref:D-alanine--D-alanine ligase n=1 Tax=Scopulibacillus daqui TaxID=1469162 RepID=A0ABS2PUZ6_9BACL|nr:D-alanine-D-alanine ligase [Scopulibacillus daqui]
MPKKLTVAVIYGGKSAEYDVSLQTAFSVINAMNKEHYNLIPVHITNSGRWIEGHEITQQLDYKEQLLLDENSHQSYSNKWLTPAGINTQIQKPDIAFPLLHGPNGEDGTVQGLLELLDIAYVGSGVVGSAAGMDKVIMKDIFKSHGLNQPLYVSVTKYEWQHHKQQMLKKIDKNIGIPCFIKPANNGSSIGINQCKTWDEIEKAVDEAFYYDEKVIIEEKIAGREIEIGVIGNDELSVSVPGEIKTNADYYDYQSKYHDGDTSLIIPADLNEQKKAEIEQTAKQAFHCLDCKGLARVDFFMRASDQAVLINEINTMPGFTPYSMFPLLWKHTGVDYSELIDKLIRLGIERHQRKKRIRYRLE